MKGLHSRHTRMDRRQNTFRNTYRKMHSRLNKMMIICFGWKPDFADEWRISDGECMICFPQATIFQPATYVRTQFLHSIVWLEA